MPTASFTALPLATLTLTARVRPALPPTGRPSDRVDHRSGGHQGDPEEPGSGAAG